jgi:hypothetical protein
MMIDEPATEPEGPRDALQRAMDRRRASYAELPGLGNIRADRSIPIRNRNHSVRHRAIR